MGQNSLHADFRFFHYLPEGNTYCSNRNMYMSVLPINPLPVLVFVLDARIYYAFVDKRGVCGISLSAESTSGRMILRRNLVKVSGICIMNHSDWPLGTS